MQSSLLDERTRPYPSSLDKVWLSEGRQWPGASPISHNSNRRLPSAGICCRFWYTCDDRRFGSCPLQQSRAHRDSGLCGVAVPWQPKVTVLCPVEKVFTLRGFTASRAMKQHSMTGTDTTCLSLRVPRSAARRHAPRCSV